jgi:hypothetical protein
MIPIVWVAIVGQAFWEQALWKVSGARLCNAGRAPVHGESKVPRHIVCLTFDFDTQSGFIGCGYRMLALEGLVKDLQRAGAVFMTMEDAAREAQARMFTG